MRIRKLLTWGVIFLCSVWMTVAIAPLTWGQTTSSSQAPPPLFTPIKSASRGASRSPNPGVVRQRTVKANPRLITRTRGGTINLNLFEDTAFSVVVEKVESKSQRSQPILEIPGKKPKSRGAIAAEPAPKASKITVQFGRVKNQPKSEVYLATQGDLISGTVQLPTGKLYDISPAEAGTHLIREIDPSKLPPDESPELYKKMRSTTQPRSRGRSTDIALDTAKDKSALSVLVLYTPKLREAAGGVDRMRLFIARIEAQTNQGYQQSGVDLRVQLDSGEFNYEESGDAETDLNILSQVAIEQNWRQRFNVRAVSLWVTDLGQSCGIGNLNRSGSDFNQHAFTVVDAECAIGGFTFAHEIGHNLGSCHDRQSDANCEGILPYSHGYQDPDGEFRTIMSYPCTVNNRCPRLNYWSSPNLILNERKRMGVPRAVDNVRSLNEVT